MTRFRAPIRTIPLPGSAAEELASALGGMRLASGWVARCPAHNDRNPSLAISESVDGKVLFHCHAGCSQLEVLDILKARGFWPNIAPVGNRCRLYDRGGAEQRMAKALSVWDACQPAPGTLVEQYLMSRGLNILPSVLRHHLGLKHAAGGIWPSMVALVANSLNAKPMAIHRTFLTRDGRKAPVKPAKMMLGPCRGGVVRLAEPTQSLLVGEGIETCLSVMQATGRPAWAALSASGLRSLDLPEHIRDVVVLADGDAAGEQAAVYCAQRLAQNARRVRIARPPQGFDFNDVLNRSCADLMRAAS